MNSLIYAGVVLAGAVTLLIEAYRNYNSSLTSIPFKEHPILQNVEVAKLCTPREKNIGFMFYSLLYLVSYIVILSSTEVYELVSQAAQANSEVGPTDALIGENNDPFGLAGTQYGKPIFISAAIISIFSLGALRPVESTMRSLAHRLAGVPRGVYNVIEDLHAIPFHEFPVECPKPLTDMFDKNARKVFEGSYDESQIKTIETSLRTVDYLAPAITGKLRIQYFPFTQLDKMSELSTILEGKVEELKDLLKKPLEEEETDRQKVFQLANSVANDTIALFAVHFLRNNRAIKHVREDTAISRIYDSIQRSYQVELNSFAMGMLLSICAAVIAAFSAYYLWVVTVAPITPEALQASVVQRLETQEQRPEMIAVCRMTPANVGRFDAPSPGITDAGLTPLEGPEAKACEAAWNGNLKTRLSERRQLILAESFWAVFGVFLACAFAAISAIFGRDVRKEDNSWPEWKIRRIPFLRLFSMAIVPALLAILGVAIGSFLKFWVDSNFNLTENQIAFFFQSKWAFFAMHAGLGFIVAIAVLFLTDQHDNMHDITTFFLGFVFAVIALGWYYLTIIAGYPAEFMRGRPEGLPFGFEMRETIIFGAHTFFFLIFFSIFLEVTEDRPGDKRTSVSLKPPLIFRPKKAKAA